MKQLKRVVALILTVVLAVYGLPMTPMAFAVESIDDTGEVISTTTSTLPSTAMRFVQTGFDESTGILTMSLQIKPVPGENGETVREGVFAFQVDATRVVPVTNPRANSEGVTVDEFKEFRTYNGEIAAAITVDSSSTQVIKDFANSGSQYVNLVSTSNKFDLTMSATNMFSKYTGLLVSGTRFQKGLSSMVDCYFQFYLNAINDIQANEDGYVNIIDLKFQCYDSDGKTKATSTEVLSAGSIRVPKEDEIDDIIKQFSFVDESGATISMAMGAAGFVQQYKKSDGITTEGNAYYYYGKQPVLNKWRKNGGSRAYWAKTPAAATTISAEDTAPGIWYENCDKKYLVEELYVTNANTMEGDWIVDPNDSSKFTEITNPDFTYPVGSNGSVIESGRYPRYLIPSYTQSITNDNVKNWIPEAYQGNGKRPALKYYASTGVADGAITTPEEEDYTKFVEELEWEIMLPDGTSLEDVAVTETGSESRLVETADGAFYRVVEATITDENYNDKTWFGKSVWNVYKVADKNDASKDTYFMKTPIGITLDMTTSDVILTDGTTGDETVNKVKAPQLHMTYEAAEPRSVIWNTSAANTTINGEKCKLGLRAVYIDGDRRVNGETINIGLYKNDAAPNSIDFYDDEVVTKVTNAQGTSVDGFWIGNTKADGSGEETPNDIIANGAGIRVVLCDQYHVGYDNKFPTVELVPTTETERAYRNAGKTNPFIVERTEGNEYTIIYRDGANANDAVKGEYILRAVYTSVDGSKVSNEKNVYINRSDDRLAFVRTGLSYTYNLNSEEEVDGGIVYDITYNVPIRSGTNKIVTVSENVTFMEIANQWRDKEFVPDDLSKYDLVANLRKADGTSIDLAKARANGVLITLEASSPDGEIPQGVDVSKLNSSGDFTFNSNTLDAAKLNIKATVTYKGQSRFVEYHITFARELQRLSQVKIYTPDNQPTFKITVPLKTENDVEQIIEVVPLDQYGSTWNWEDVTEAYTPGNRLNPDASAQPYDKWKVFADGELPEGVRFSGENNNTIIVTSEAKNSTFKIYGKFAAATSELVTVEIVRKPSKPTTVSNLTYNETNEVISPTAKRSNLTLKPTVKVYDQYDEEIVSCAQSWKCKVTSDTKNASDYIHIDTKTGELTVDKCAPNCTLTIEVRYSANGGTKSQKCTVQVKRETAYAETVTVKTESIPYPTLDDTSDPIKYMSAEGTTQYGESEQLDSDTMNWTLDSVEFADGTLNRVNKVGDNEVETGDIPYNSLTGVYSARGGVVSVTNHGGVSFSRTTIENNVPRAITVTVTTSNSQKATKRIVISREASVPNTLYISEDISEYKNGIQLPHKGDKTTVALQAYVRDQYGVIMSNANIEWDNDQPLPDGVKLDKTAKTITVDHTTSENASISLTASCKVSESKTLKKSLYLSVFTNEPLVAQAIEIVGVKDSAENSSAAENDEVEMTLPAQTGKGYDTYTAMWKVKDQFDRAVQKAVKWTVQSADSGVDARISDSAAGMVRLYYTDDALNTLISGGKMTFTMRVEAAENSTVYKDVKVSLKLDEAVATFASPVLVTNEGIGNINSDGEPIVPKKGEAANSVKISTVVYDQYGRAMDGEHGEIELLTKMTGLSFTPLTGTGSGLLNVASNVTGTLVTLRATPKNKSANVNDNSTLEIRLNKGTAYAAELALEDDNEYTFEIPTWVTEPLDNAPSEDTYDTLTLGAKIVDQYGAEMIVSSDMYLPTWEFVGEHEGVEFDTDGKAANADETFDGQTVTLRISNRAIPQGKTSETVTLKVSATRMRDDSFTKTFKVNLTRDAAAETFFYIQGADEDGNESEPPMRPYAEDKKTVYQFKPTVYDQYGASMEVEGIEMDMNIDALTALDNIEVEQEFKRGESAENGDKPIKYHVNRVIYRDENDKNGTKTLLADFDRETGELVIYTECDCIEQFVFTAEYSALGVAGKKALVVPVGQEQLRAYNVKVNRSYGDFKIRGTEDTIYDYVYLDIYDQYGDGYNGGVNVVWDLLLNEKDENGEYKAYTTEYDKEGVERPKSEFLLQKTDGGDGTTTLSVLPESFYEPKSFVLRSTVVDYNASGKADWVVTNTVINVRKPSSGSSGILVTFDPGEYGKLVGEGAVTVVSGAAPEVTPGVKTVEGYGFVGWTSDGSSIVDATKIALFGDTVYSAVYKDVTGTKFVEGYDDMTIRPENHITRAEFVTMVVRAIGGYDSSKNYGESFVDVSAKSWYANTIAYAKQMNLIDGYEDGTFKPNNSITRAEAAKILAEAAGLTSENTGTFPDVAEGRWYTEYVEALAEHGVIIGYANGEFRPANKITRAEAIKMIVMITVNAPSDFELDNIQKYAYCAFTDIRKTHWAYAYILRGAGIA